MKLIILSSDEKFVISKGNSECALGIFSISYSFDSFFFINFNSYSPFVKLKQFIKKSFIFFGYISYISFIISSSFCSNFTNSVFVNCLFDSSYVIFIISDSLFDTVDTKNEFEFSSGIVFNALEWEFSFNFKYTKELFT